MLSVATMDSRTTTGRTMTAMDTVMEEAVASRKEATDMDAVTVEAEEEAVDVVVEVAAVKVEDVVTKVEAVVIKVEDVVEAVVVEGERTIDTKLIFDRAIYN
mmetsp:Transcript_21507/g.53138  ORF Transcript_21507/g.53138 Transcript_21507/m.53138 type:complete len:102 (+) Transcript_21507:2852-3157(+)